MKPLDRLKLLELNVTKLKCPNMPEHCIALTKWSDKSANGLEKAICYWINNNGGMAERVKNMGRYINGESTYEDVIGRTRVIGTGTWIKGTGKNGTSDIHSTINGRTVAIEVKIGRDSKSDDQIKYEQKIKAAGGMYWEVKTFEQFLQLWDELKK